MPKSTTLIPPRKAKKKPEKPHKDFPLFAHATGRWAKKVRGKLCYFGPWADPDGALDKWLEQKDDLLAGRTPRASADDFTIADAVNHYLTSKVRRRDSGELHPRTFIGYDATAKRLVSYFGRNRLVSDLVAGDFEAYRAELAKSMAPKTLSGEIQGIRSIFRYVLDNGLIQQPVRFGTEFKKPSARTMRHERLSKGPKMFEADQVRTLLAESKPQMKAMILLGVNCGLGNHDVGALPLSALDLDGRWLNYPRGKTGINRRCSLWPETIKALREVIADRPRASHDEDTDIVFLTANLHNRWVRLLPSGAWVDALGIAFVSMLKKLGMHRPGLAFYALRHTFETIGGESRDQVAVDAVMGHSPPAHDMASVYRERISDERLQAVAEHVRAWLFAKKRKAK